ncbi:hypothetical protein [Alicyclobacillus sp. ALC3]|nr:hypothetical protein [Alicyclobacillus sp. ALC3]
MFISVVWQSPSHPSIGLGLCISRNRFWSDEFDENSRSPAV